ncbi:SNF2 family N-terminal domain/Helicase conserved C-terminal domain containing protein [Novymonas esmeraldas]|uniref:SNF2 family N-terminal domain/Helicase conserved C-terminal domain containing protein n=1 Tax=Novymonas esmeraldas TaxID=1808958 RepID=A0AAW0ELN4_9TRYP
MGGARQTSQAAAATDASPLLSAARVCGGHVQLIKRVKQWLWQLEDGADVANGSDGSCRLAGRKRHLDVRGDAEDAGAAAAAEDADTSTLAPPPMTTRAVAVAAAAVTADPSLRRRRGRPPKHLSEMMAAAAAATARAALMPTPIQVGSAGLARMVAAQTQVSAFTAAMNGRLESGYRAFRPVLILAPLSTLPHWADEFYRFSRRDAGAVLERFTVYVLNGSRPERESCMDAFLAHVERPAPAAATSPPPATPALVIPHDLLTRPQSGSLRHIRRVEWHVVVVDEAQRIKSARSTLFKRVGELRAVSRLALTGTPLQNNTTELFSLLRFVAPHAFASSDLFEQLDTALLAASRSSALEDRELHILLCRRVHRLLTPFILRREKSILKAALPPIRDYAVLCPLLPFQRAQLEEVERRHLAGALSGNPHVQYRKILLHPYTTQAFFYVDEEVVRTSGKLLVLDFMMRFLQRTEHKFLVFCGWTLVLDVVETLCGMRGIPYVRLDGRTSVEQRAANIKDFNHHHHHHNNTHISGGEGEGEATAMRPRRHPRPPAGAGAASVAGADSTGVLDGSDDVDYHGDGGSPPAPPPCCFLISKVAGGVGLNLQAADTVFLLDVDYNPQRDAQALSRVYRVGQTKEVRVLRLVIDHPVERDVVAIHEAKDNLGRAVVQAGRYDLRSSLQEREAALQSLFRAGALSQLSEQWATTTEAEEAPSLLSVCVPDAPGPHGDDDGGSTPAEAARDPPPRSQPTAVHPCTPTPLSALPRHVAAKAGMCAGAKEGRETSSVAHPCERCAPATTADGADDASGVSATAGPHRRLRRRVSFKLEGDDDDGGNNGEGRHRAGDEVLSKGAAPSSFSALPAAAAAADSEEERAAASAGSGGRALTPAEHLLAMRGRLAEVLLRHDGERHVLEDMFRSVERALRSESR